MNKIIKLDEHDEIFHHILKLNTKSNIVFINIDAHSDMSMRQNKYEIDIGNFISELIYRKCFNEILWIKNKKSFDFLDGNYKFFIGENNEKNLKSTLINPYYIFEESYEKFEKLNNLNKVNFYVRSSCENIDIKFNNKKWILSIDYDFFSCNSPRLQEFKKLESIVNESLLNKIKIEAMKIKSITDLKEFKNTFNKINPNFYEKIKNCVLTEFKLSEEEIKKLILEINYFIYKNFNLDDCCGIFICESIISGYTNKEHYNYIDKMITQYLLK